MGSGPIPSIALRAYARDMGVIDPDLLQRFRDLIRRMDREYLSVMAARGPDKELKDESTSDEKLRQKRDFLRASRRDE
jgi:hypothetical protein